MLVGTYQPSSSILHEWKARANRNRWASPRLSNRVVGGDKEKVQTTLDASTTHHESHITSLNRNKASPFARFAAMKSSLFSAPLGPFNTAEKHSSTKTFNSSYTNGSSLPVSSASLLLI